MKKDFKGHANKSGVYKIVNIKNGKTYIGSAKNFKKRAYQHNNQLKTNRHYSKHLQASWNKWGEDVFLFEVIEVVEGGKDERVKKEQEYIDTFLENWEKCYNLSKHAIKNGDTWSFNPEVTKRKRSKIMKEMWKDPAYRGKLEKYHNCPIEKKKASVRNKLKWQNKSEKKKQEVIDRLTDVSRNRPRTKEHYKKIAKSRAWYSHSDETKEKLSKANLGKKLSYETCKKMSLSRQGEKSPTAKIYKNIKLKSPQGKVYTEIKCLSQFAREHNLCNSTLCSLLKGKVKNHKGWHLIKNIYSDK